MTQITTTKYSALSAQEQTKLHEIIFQDLNQIVDVGDLLVSEHGIYVIIDMFITSNEISVTIQESQRNTSTNTLKYFLGFGYTPYKGTTEELKADAWNTFIEGKLTGGIEMPQEEGLVHTNKNDYLSKKHDLILSKNQLMSKLKVMESLAKSKMYEIRKWSEEVTTELTRVNKILWTLELYLGINEEIRMIQDGIPASDDEPIHLMQEMLFMDEEVGDPTDGGLDIRSIKMFDEWLLKHNTYYGYKNLNLIVPYNKCFRIMRVRRERKDYNDKFESMIMDKENFKTYILLRNGEQLFKIHADISFGKKLFPNQDEIMSVLEKPDQWKKGTGEEQALELIDIYRRNFLIIQGLIDRTEVFGSLAGTLNVIDGSGYNDGKIVLHYESDLSQFISDGRISFDEFVQTGRKDIKVGTQVLVHIPYSDRDKDRFVNAHWNQRVYPPYPKNGIYNITEIAKTSFGGGYIFKYLPEGDTWNGYEYKERKKQVSFSVYEDEMINYDSFTYRHIKMLEQMLHDRRERKHYTRYMDKLTHVYKAKLAEYKLELEFVRNMIKRELPNVTDDQVLDCVDWWKKKVNQTRTLQSDDAKALRMIVSKLKQLYQ